ncbi:hypothetical protein BKG82_27320 [Mycobacteroides chelonae]|uniref:Uncharacterized protein n=1 Tax=Mycobacteroides chelonae TaxID=1774 RepID=A0A1S1LJ67_MYCCH|nr:hypothetical protein [Mycobacteroides chelonae]OHU47362.1 hypothetical protein BKG82_27320 [Mycobacteroides chelonae]
MDTAGPYQGICIPWRYLSTGLWETFASVAVGLATMVAATPQFVLIQAVIAGALVGTGLRVFIAAALHHRDRRPVQMNASRALLYAEQLIDFAHDLRFLGATGRAGKLRQCSHELLVRVREDPAASARQRSRAASLLTSLGVDGPAVGQQPRAATLLSESRGV